MVNIMEFTAAMAAAASSNVASGRKWFTHA